LEDVVVRNNHADARFGVGGGIAIELTVVTIRRSTISGNSAAGGGGIFNRGGLEIDESRIFRNSTTVSDTRPPDSDAFLELSGGGIGNVGGLRVFNSTI